MVNGTAGRTVHEVFARRHGKFLVWRSGDEIRRKWPDYVSKLEINTLDGTRRATFFPPISVSHAEAEEPLSAHSFDKWRGRPQTQTLGLDCELSPADLDFGTVWHSPFFRKVLELYG